MGVWMPYTIVVVVTAHFTINTRTKYIYSLESNIYTYFVYIVYVLGPGNVA